jgi:hypothetical protein
MESVFETNINKKELFKTFGDSFASTFAENIEFESLPFYIYAEIPDGLDVFQDAKFEGDISAWYGHKINENDEKPTKNANSQVKELHTGDFKLVGMPELVKNANGYVTAPMTGEKIDFAAAFNLEAPESTEKESLCIDYNIGLKGATTEGITITPDTLNSLNGKSSIAIDLVLVLNLSFNIKDTVSLNLMEIMNKDDGSGNPKTDQEKDLFKRSEKTDTTSFKQYLDVVKSASLELTNPKFPIKSTGGLELKVDWKNGKPAQNCKLQDNKSAIIEVNPSTLLETYPLEPDISIIINKGTFGLPKDMSIKTGLKLRVTAEGPITVYPFPGQEAE